MIKLCFYSVRLIKMEDEDVINEAITVYMKTLSKIREIEDTKKGKREPGLYKRVLMSNVMSECFKLMVSANRFSIYDKSDELDEEEEEGGPINQDVEARKEDEGGNDLSAKESAFSEKTSTDKQETSEESRGDELKYHQNGSDGKPTEPTKDM